jgi:hypothetical protein
MRRRIYREHPQSIGLAGLIVVDINDLRVEFEDSRSVRNATLLLRVITAPDYCVQGLPSIP